MAKESGLSSNALGILLILGGIGAGAGLALLRKPATPAPTPAPEVVQPAPPPRPGGAQMPPGSALPPGHPALPSGHMPIGSASGMPGNPMLPPPEAAKASIEWVVPAKWTKVPNASAFRIATYDIAHQPGDSENPQLTVSRIGGDVEANAQRWIAQFDEAGQKTAKRSERTVAGFKTSIVEVQGTYGGMGGAAQTGWALLGAIVETPGTAHFFKLTGPQKSVLAARADFDALIASIKPLAP